jgi:homogentisate 1,2-dioxygenase
MFTEMAIMDVEPLEICLIPRGMMFKIPKGGEQTVWRG